MMNELARFLDFHGPMASGPLAAGLASALGISVTTARKRIERRSPPVRTVNLQLHRGAQFFYTESQYASSIFWERLAATLTDGNGAYARAIRAMTARGGIVPRAHFAAAAGTSGAQSQLSGDEVIRRFILADLFHEIEMPGLGACVAFPRGEIHNDERLLAVRARMIAETVLLQSTQEWAAKLGLGSFSSFKVRSNQPSELPRVGPFAWDLSAPSFLGPLVNWSNPGTPKQGFLVVDVLLTDVVGVDEISPFIYKCESLRQLRNVGRCLQFFVANRYSREALNLARKAGIVPATPESLFGTEVARALLELIRTLSTAAERAVDPVKFSELFDRLGKAEAAAGTLRGALFEYVVADVARRLGPESSITLNQIYREGGKDVAEVDVQVQVPNRFIRFIECKGILPCSVLSDAEVEKWLHRRIPIVSSQTRRRNDLAKLKQRFELWLTGELSPEARAMVAAAQMDAVANGISIEVIFADDIDRLLRELNDPALRRVVDQHFLKAPMAFPVDVVNQFSKRSLPKASILFGDVPDMPPCVAFGAATPAPD